MKNPEFLKVGQKLVFREGRTKAVGNVTKIIGYTPPTQAQLKAKLTSKPMQTVSRYIIIFYYKHKFFTFD